MKSRILSAVLVFSFTGLAMAAKPGENPSSSSNAARFEVLKKLAGDWVQLGKDGKPTNQVVSSFHVTANGTALQETIFPGGDHEMVTMYHLDGPELILTHYCMMGNQPRMKAEPGEANRIAFKFVGATNLKSKDDGHMDQATFTLIDDNHFQAEWVSCKDGSACHKVNLDLVRRTK